MALWGVDVVSKLFSSGKKEKGAAGGRGYCAIENNKLLRIVPENILVTNTFLVEDAFLISVGIL